MNRARGKTRARRGYLLVTVVVMIAIAALMLARMSATSTRMAMTAMQEERDLRHQWAVTSLRRFSLDRAPALTGSPVDLSVSSDNRDEAVPILWKNVSIAGEEWRVIIGDESSKLNLGHLRSTEDSHAIQGIMESLIGTDALIRPISELPSSSTRKARRWEHWLERGSYQSTTWPRQIAQGTQRMTLWGDGKLNILRCERETIDVLWRQLFGRAAPPSVDELRDRAVFTSRQQMIGAMGLRESQFNQAERWITNESSCFSVWIFCESDRRVPASLYVDWGRGAAAEHRGYEY